MELALLDKFLYYFNEEMDLKKSSLVSKELDKLFPGSEGALDAHRMLGDISNENDNKKVLSNDIESGKLEIFENYPNPFNPATIINYSLPVDEKVIIKVYDILGREVAELVNEFKTAGNYSVNFEASSLSSGVYFYSISAGNFHQTKKMVLTK